MQLHGQPHALLKQDSLVQHSLLTSLMQAQCRTVRGSTA